MRETLTPATPVLPRTTIAGSSAPMPPSSPRFGNASAKAAGRLQRLARRAGIASGDNSKREIENRSLRLCPFPEHAEWAHSRKGGPCGPGICPSTVRSSSFDIPRLSELRLSKDCTKRTTRRPAITSFRDQLHLTGVFAGRLPPSTKGAGSRWPSSWRRYPLHDKGWTGRERQHEAEPQ